MADEWDDIQEEPIDEEPIEEDDNVVDSSQPGRFAKLLGSDSRRFKLSGMFKD